MSLDNSGVGSANLLLWTTTNGGQNIKNTGSHMLEVTWEVG